MPNKNGIYALNVVKHVKYTFRNPVIKIRKSKYTMKKNCIFIIITP